MVESQILIERSVPKLANLYFCKKGKPSELATSCYEEILQNIEIK